jgi:hypothetical protein
MRIFIRRTFDLVQVTDDFFETVFLLRTISHAISHAITTLNRFIRPQHLFRIVFSRNKSPSPTFSARLPKFWKPRKSFPTLMRYTPDSTEKMLLYFFIV